MTIKLNAPPINAEQGKQLTAHREALQASIGLIEKASAKITDLRTKEKELEAESRKHERDAASFHKDSEIKLIAAQKGIQRIHNAIALAESGAYDDKAPLWPAFDSAQETIAKICQASLNQLLDQIGAAMAPFFDKFENARWQARQAPAVNDLIRVLLTHPVQQYDSTERLYESAQDVLRKVDALLNGSEIWRYEGADAPKPKTAASA